MSFVNDPIADLLTRIRNSLKAQHLFVDIPHSKMKEAIIKILKEHGFLAHFLVKEENKKKTMRVFLKYKAHREPVIRHLRRVSKPSLRVFVSAKNIPIVFGSMGVPVLSTSYGILDGKTAKEKRIGGELLCLVW